ncbi:hypothetical protein PLICRDRAFT_113200 [Plicaturopsis crispa FD-325 SS-3]|nr:hypothetical protein PLICRDRAFT_113200 [Plicaturopsis crispa FD-325 SS-3]
MQQTGPHSAPPASPSRLPERTNLPARSSTTDSAPEPDRNAPPQSMSNRARSEDLNHSAPGPSAGLLHPSRPTTPGNPSSSHSEDLSHRTSVASFSSNASSAQSGSARGAPPTSVSSASNSASLASSTCSACGKPMQGAFVRALGTVFHLNCFKCMDCGDVVASKFFPIEGSEGKQQPLCERDYFRRLNLICAKCGMALRGSYITACNKKYHVEHFTCSLCTTLFGPQDSYYEHDGDVYCHFHYSTRFATKCAGCNSAILKQFVEINRNMRDECWHPECYMINKFWNVKIVSRRSVSPALGQVPETDSTYVEEEQRESPASLKDKQIRMEQQVYRIWTVLSAFEESSAACISDMLRQVSNGQYSDAIRMAEKFILHVEVLFGAIDDLEFQFARLNMKGMSHVREARMLCRKTVDLFTLLSHTQETGSRRMGMTQELLALVTGLAHYLKILIRIALTGALKLEREQSVQEAMASFLDKLHLLAVQGGNPGARRMIKGTHGEVLPHTRNGVNLGTQGVTYGFRSLAPENAGESPFGATPSRDPATKITANNPPSDLCVRCGKTVEEDCVRLGTYQRWHSQCVQCKTCGKVAAVPAPKEVASPKNPEDKEKDGPKLSTVRRPPANVGLFVYEVDSTKDTPSFGDVPTVILCTEHGHAGCRSGFQAVSRLEQYAFLLNVALRRLYLLLKKQGVVPLSPAPTSTANQAQRVVEQDPYRNSGDIMRMKSVHLDRKLSATARLPKWSTIVESPTGKSAQPTNALQSQRSQELSAQGSQVAHQSGGRSPPMPQQQPSSAVVNQSKSPGMLDTQQRQVLRPSFARNNTEVMIVDQSVPNSPSGEQPPSQPAMEDGITLADIPQLMEAAQAREQRRSLPRQNAIPYIAELSALELAIVKHSAVLALFRSPLKDQFDLEEILELVEVKKSGFWGKLFKGDNKKNVKKKGVFGVPLELLVEREGSDSLLGATRATMRVPSFIDDVISAMRQMDMSIEGIFRKNGNIRRLRDLTEAIDRDPSSVDLSQDNPVQLAALLKKFLRDLPDPLMTFKLHRLFIASQTVPSDAERKRLLHMVSIILPKSHRDTMEVLFVFLKWVASFAHMDEETGSKMDLGNLATVICPSILYSRGRDAGGDQSMGAFGAIRVVTALLEHQDDFFAVPEEFLGILHDQDYFQNSMDLPSKEFMKKCDTYMRVQASGRAPPLSSPSTSSAPYNPSNQFPPSNRPPITTSMSEAQVRNGRNQSPNGAHMAYPQPGPPASLSQSAAMLQQGQGPPPRQDGDWSRPPNSSPSPRPTSYVPPRQSGEHNFPPNGHPASPVVRQRT